MKRITIHLDDEMIEFLEGLPGSKAENIRKAVHKYYLHIRMIEREYQELKEGSQ